MIQFALSENIEIVWNWFAVEVLAMLLIVCESTGVMIISSELVVLVLINLKILPLLLIEVGSVMILLEPDVLIRIISSESSVV